MGSNEKDQPVLARLHKIVEAREAIKDGFYYRNEDDILGLDRVLDAILKDIGFASGNQPPVGE